MVLNRKGRDPCGERPQLTGLLRTASYLRASDAEIRGSYFILLFVGYPEITCIERNVAIEVLEPVSYAGIEKC